MAYFLSGLFGVRVNHEIKVKEGHKLASYKKDKISTAMFNHFIYVLLFMF